jgi:hypothetical protein
MSPDGAHNAGVATPKPDMELIETRLKRAAEIAL